MSRNDDSRKDDLVALRGTRDVAANAKEGRVRRLLLETSLSKSEVARTAGVGRNFVLKVSKGLPSAQRKP